MKILMTGTTGLIGGALTAALKSAGHQVTPLVRHSPAPPAAILWDPLAATMDPGPFAGVEGVIHLAGENLAEGRWTAAKKKRVFASRVDSTRLLAATVAQLRPLPRVFLCASAVGYYGDRGEALLAEDAAPGVGYAADMCLQWEKASASAAAAGIRVVHTRLGIVLSGKGGALAKMRTPFRLGIGGPIGNGRQYVSWITLDDVTGAIMHLLFDSQLAGPVNLVAPEPVTNRDFAKALGRVLHRPAVLPLPAPVIRLVLGEMADDLLLASARVVPRRLQADGFTFAFPDLEPAMKHALGIAGGD